MDSAKFEESNVLQRYALGMHLAFAVQVDVKWTSESVRKSVKHTHTTHTDRGI